MRTRPKRRTRHAVAVREVTKYLPLVKAIARRVARSLPPWSSELDDLISAGVVGLLEAAERFDPERADRFETFAEFRIHGAMMDYLRCRDSLSRDMRRLSNTIRDAAAALEAKLCRAPTPDEVAAHLGIGLDELRERQGKLTGSSVVGIDDAGPDLLERVGDESDEGAFDVAWRHETVARIAEAIPGLTKKAQRVIMLYYRDGLTLFEISEVLGVTESRVCQIHGESIRRLQEALPR